MVGEGRGVVMGCVGDVWGERGGEVGLSRRGGSWLGRRGSWLGRGGLLWEGRGRGGGARGRAAGEGEGGQTKRSQ